MNPPASDLSFIHLISHASLIVQLIMLLLFIASLASWWHIFRKLFLLRQTWRDTDQFEQTFWSGADMGQLFQRVSSPQYQAGSLEKIFEAGFREFLKLKRQANLDVAAVMDGTRRAMRATYQREIDFLEAHLELLATIGSVSPYVGLFGTVWGIMNSFMSLGKMQQATLAVVAPGIAEALIATAIGLFAAIPAVIAYNRFSDKIDRLVVSYDNFREEFTALLERHYAAQRKNA